MTGQPVVDIHGRRLQLGAQDSGEMFLDGKLVGGGASTYFGPLTPAPGVGKDGDTYLRSSASTKRQVCANNCKFGNDSVSVTQTTFNNTSRHRVPLNANWSQIQIMVANFNNADGASSGGTFLNLKASIQQGANIYPGSVTIASTAAGAVATISVPNVTLTAGTDFYVHMNWQMASGTKSLPLNGYLTSMPVFDTGSLRGTDNTVDITTTGIPYGSAVQPTVASGSITALTLILGGAGFTAGTADVYAYEQQANGALAQKLIGSATITSGAVTSVTLTDGTPPSNVAAWINPKISIAHGGLITLASASVIGFGPTLITGIPDRPTRSALLVGTSITYGYQDRLGDLWCNDGNIEMGINSRVGVANAGIPGLRVYRTLDLTAQYQTYWKTMAPYCTDAILELGVNDHAWFRTYGQITADIASVKAIINGLGIPASLCTVTPRCQTSTDGWTTLAGQTVDVINAINFNDGFRTQYNKYVRGNLIASDNQFIDFSALVESQLDPGKWDVFIDATHSVCTVDGVHPFDSFTTSLKNGCGRSLINTAFQKNFEFLNKTFAEEYQHIAGSWVQVGSY